MKVTKLILVLALFAPQILFAQGYMIKEPNKAADVYKSWANQCETDPNSKKEVCYSSQTIVLKDRDAEILYIAIGHIPESDKPLLRLTTPLGTLLPEGMVIKVDEGEESRLPFLFCNQVGCHIEVGVTEKFLTAIQKGNNLNVKFLDLGGRSFQVPVSLSGFTKAYKSLKKG